MIGGMIALQNLMVRLVGDPSSYNAMMKSAQQNANAAMGNIGKAATGIEALSQRIITMGAKAQSVGLAMTAAITAPIAAIAGASVKSFSDFDKAMTNSTSIMKVTDDQVKRMRDSAISLGTQGVNGPTDLAKAYYFLASAGLDTEQSIAALGLVSNFATAGMIEMETATSLLANAQSAMGLKSKDAAENLANMTRVADNLTNIANIADGSIRQFSEALTNDAAASARSYGKSIEEVTALLGVMADQGNKGLSAGTDVARINRILASSALENADAHKKLGFAVFDAQGNFRNYADIIADLERITQGMTGEQKAATLELLGFDARIQGAIQPLIGMSEKMREYEAIQKKVAGTTKDVAEKQLKSFEDQMKVTKNQIAAAAIEIGEILAPAIGVLNGWLREAVAWFRELSPEMKTTVVVVAGLTAAIGPLLVVVGFVGPAFVTGFGMATAAVNACSAAVVTLTTFLLTNPIGLAITGIAAGATGIFFLAKSFYNAANSVDDFDNKIAALKQSQQELQQQYAQTTAEIRQQAAAIESPVERRSFLQDELKKAEVEFSQIQKRVDELNGQVIEGDTIWARMFGNEEHELVKQRLDGVAKEYDATAARIKALRQEMAKVSDQKIAEAAAKEAKKKQEALTKALFDRGKELTKQMMTPVEKEAERIKELDKLLSVGAISAETYARAIAGVKDEIKGAADQAERWDAAAFGSAEAIQRVQQWRDLVKGIRGSSMPAQRTATEIADAISRPLSPEAGSAWGKAAAEAIVKGREEEKKPTVSNSTATDNQTSKAEVSQAENLKLLMEIRDLLKELVKKPSLTQELKDNLKKPLTQLGPGRGVDSSIGVLQDVREYLKQIAQNPLNTLTVGGILGGGG